MKKIIVSCIFLTIIFFSQTFAIEIESEKAILIDATNGRIIYQKDAYEKAYPASTTKIMTAILALERLNLNDKLIASENAITSVPDGGSIVKIQIGEELSVESLLEGLLVASGNEAANILAEGISGSIEDFVTLMNEKCAELELTLTHFVNSNGLHNENHYSCAYDLAILYQYAYNKFPDFRRISAMKSFTIPVTSKYEKDDRAFTNSNKLIIEDSKYYYPCCTGGKTGYTSEAKNCLAASAEKNGVKLIGCVLGGGTTEAGDSQRYLDAKNMFDYGFENLTLRTIANSGDVVDSLKIDNSKNKKDVLNVIFNKPFQVTVDNSDLSTEYIPSITIKEDLLAPITSGDVVGKARYNIYNKIIDVDLVAGNSIEEKPPFSLGGFLVDLFVTLLKLVGILIILILIIRFYNKVIKKSAKKRRSRAKRYNARFHR